MKWLLDLEVRVAQSGGHVEVGELPTIDADPLQMRQMLQNLIGNALKFRRKDVAPVVSITGNIIAETASCEIRVEDNGIGFDIKYLSRIFAPFQRLHTRQQYEGSGMGLAICRKIVERHRGKITASSVPGQGAIFIISLPVKQGGATESAVICFLVHGKVNRRYSVSILATPTERKVRDDNRNCQSFAC